MVLRTKFPALSDLRLLALKVTWQFWEAIPELCIRNCVMSSTQSGLCKSPRTTTNGASNHAPGFVRFETLGAQGAVAILGDNTGIVYPPLCHIVYTIRLV